MTYSHSLLVPTANYTLPTHSVSSTAQWLRFEPDDHQNLLMLLLLLLLIGDRPVDRPIGKAVVILVETAALPRHGPRSGPAHEKPLLAAYCAGRSHSRRTQVSWAVARPLFSFVFLAHGPACLIHVRLVSRGPARPANVSSRGPRPGPPQTFSEVGPRLGPTHSICIFHGPAFPGPSHFRQSRLCPVQLIAFKNIRPGLAEPVIFSFSSSRPGPDRPGQTAYDNPLYLPLLMDLKNI